MKSMLLNKMCKYHQCVCATDFVFCNNLKSLWLFVKGTRELQTSESADRTTSSLHHCFTALNPSSCICQCCIVFCFVLFCFGFFFVFFFSYRSRKCIKSIPSLWLQGNPYLHQDKKRFHTTSASLHGRSCCSHPIQE